mgnify:FL=1
MHVCHYATQSDQVGHSTLAGRRDEMDGFSHSSRRRKFPEGYEERLAHRVALLASLEEKWAIQDQWSAQYSSIIEDYFMFSSEYPRLASINQITSALFGLLEKKADRRYYSELLVALAGVMAELRVSQNSEICELAIPHAVGWLVQTLQKKPCNWKQIFLPDASDIASFKHLLEKYSYIKV